MTQFRSSRLILAATACAILTPVSAGAADPAPFDLNGPELNVTVTRGDASLPIGQVPALMSGDQLTISANLPTDQSVKYRLISAFLRGVTNPPPKDWIDSVETWQRKEKKRTLKLTVPKDARQLALFLVPDTGGDFGTVADAVRGKPGEFVRVTQDINQASLDRSRLNAFVAGIRSQENSHPEYLRTVAPILSSSLSMKLNPDCLAKVVESQAACLLEHREALVLGDIHTNSMTETIIGAPADLAMQISSTREAGYGFYSPYIGVVRDLARIFGAFNSPEFSYLPALGIQNGPSVSLLLNTAPSFRKPKSVLVAAMPAIEKDAPPPLRRTSEAAICGVRPDAVFGVEGAPLVFATDYAHGMALRLKANDGTTVEAPLVARADRGGYVMATVLKAQDFEAATTGLVHGYWGFDTFNGPEYLIQFPQGGEWRAEADTQRLIAGRDNSLTLKGPAPACVESVSVQMPGGQSRPAKWRVDGPDGIAVDIPLTGIGAGEMQVTVKPIGLDPATIATRAYAEQSRLDSLTLHAGDEGAALTGLRLDQIKSVTMDGIAFRPGDLTRDGDADRLELQSEAPDKAAALKQGHGGKAQIVLKDGRKATLPFMVAAPRPALSVLGKSIADKATPSGLPIRLANPDLLPDSARMTISFRAPDGLTLSPKDVIDVATTDGSAQVRLTGDKGLRLESQQVAIATLDPAALGTSAFGPLRYRLVQAGLAGKWQPLATLVRLPSVQSITCAAGGGDSCTMSGQNLFLLEAVASDPAFSAPKTLPPGFTGQSFEVPKPQGRALYLKLRDAPASIQTLSLEQAAR